LLTASGSAVVSLVGTLVRHRLAAAIVLAQMQASGERVDLLAAAAGASALRVQGGSDLGAALDEVSWFS
jgi:hypothetical protein